MRNLRRYLIFSLILITTIFVVISFDVFTFKDVKLYEDPTVYMYNESKEIIGVLSNTFSDTFTLEKDYYKSESFNFYIKKDHINKIKQEKLKYDDKYINYVPHFNVKIKPNSIVYLDDIKLFELKNNDTFTVYEKYEDKYGIEYNDKLIYINKEDVLEEIKIDDNKKISQGVPVILYHFFHDEKSKWSVNVGYSISMHVNDFEEQLKYLNDNNFYTVKIDELVKYVDGIINLPEKSVLLTADDGNYSVFDLAYPLIQKHKINLAVFGVTAWDPDVAIFNNEFAEVHSHSHDLHQGGCPGGQGGLIKCIDFDKGVEDLKTSQEILKGSKYLAYPFGEYNEHAFNIVKEAGYLAAFSTDYGKVKVGDDKLTLKRMYIYKDTGLNGFINMVN